MGRSRASAASMSSAEQSWNKAAAAFALSTAMMLSSALMLFHLKETEAAARLQQAVEKVYAGGKHTTPDVGGKAGTTEFTDAVIAALR
jgi:isocitrate/isopropylmalate dehydrogenase